MDSLARVEAACEALRPRLADEFAVQMLAGLEQELAAAAATQAAAERQIREAPHLPSSWRDHILARFAPRWAALGSLASDLAEDERLAGPQLLELVRSHLACACGDTVASSGLEGLLGRLQTVARLRLARAVSAGSSSPAGSDPTGSMMPAWRDSAVARRLDAVREVGRVLEASRARSGAADAAGGPWGSAADAAAMRRAADELARGPGGAASAAIAGRMEALAQGRLWAALMAGGGGSPGLLRAVAHVRDWAALGRGDVFRAAAADAAPRPRPLRLRPPVAAEAAARGCVDTDEADDARMAASRIGASWATASREQVRWSRGDDDDDGGGGTAHPALPIPGAQAVGGAVSAALASPAGAAEPCVPVSVHPWAEGGGGPGAAAEVVCGPGGAAVAFSLVPWRSGERGGGAAALSLALCSAVGRAAAGVGVGAWGGAGAMDAVAAATEAALTAPDAPAPAGSHVVVIVAPLPDARGRPGGGGMACCVVAMAARQAGRGVVWDVLAAGASPAPSGAAPGGSPVGVAVSFERPGPGAAGRGGRCRVTARVSDGVTAVEAAAPCPGGWAQAGVLACPATAAALLPDGAAGPTVAVRTLPGVGAVATAAVSAAPLQDTALPRAESSGAGRAAPALARLPRSASSCDAWVLPPEATPTGAGTRTGVAWWLVRGGAPPCPKAGLWDGAVVPVRLPWPLDLVAGRAEEAAYAALSRTLLRQRRATLLLDGTWLVLRQLQAEAHTRPTLVRDARRRGATARPARPRGAAAAAVPGVAAWAARAALVAWSLRSLVAGVDALWHGFILEPAWATLFRRLAEARDFPALAAAHRAFLAAALDGVLVGNAEAARCVASLQRGARQLHAAVAAVAAAVERHAEEPSAEAVLAAARIVAAAASDVCAVAENAATSGRALALAAEALAAAGSGHGARAAAWADFAASIARPAAAAAAKLA